MPDFPFPGLIIPMIVWEARVVCAANYISCQCFKFEEKIWENHNKTVFGWKLQSKWRPIPIAPPFPTEIMGLISSILGLAVIQVSRIACWFSHLLRGFLSRFSNFPSIQLMAFKCYSRETTTIQSSIVKKNKSKIDRNTLIVWSLDAATMAPP